MSDAISAMMAQLLAPPRPGVKAADLSERERLALAYAAGVELVSEYSEGMMKYTTAEPVGITDRPGGGYIVAHGPAPKRMIGDYT